MRLINGEMDFAAVKISLFHEYTHFIQRSARTMRLPPWYAERYAELFSSFRISNDVVTLGERPAARRAQRGPGRVADPGTLRTQRRPDPRQGRPGDPYDARGG